MDVLNVPAWVVMTAVSLASLIVPAITSFIVSQMTAKGVFAEKLDHIQKTLDEYIAMYGEAIKRLDDRLDTTKDIIEKVRYDAGQPSFCNDHSAVLSRVARTESDMVTAFKKLDRIIELLTKGKGSGNDG